MDSPKDRFSLNGMGFGIEPSDTGEGGLGGLLGDWEVAEEAAVAAAASGGGRHGGVGGGGRSHVKQSERKQLACGMCGAMRLPEDVSFRMTAKMVRETLFHVSFVWTGSSLHTETFSRQKHAAKTPCAAFQHVRKRVHGAILIVQGLGETKRIHWNVHGRHVVSHGWHQQR